MNELERISSLRQISHKVISIMNDYEKGITQTGSLAEELEAVYNAIEDVIDQWEKSQDQAAVDASFPP